jgi:hypothetical protein
MCDPITLSTMAASAGSVFAPAAGAAGAAAGSSLMIGAASAGLQGVSTLAAAKAQNQAAAANNQAALDSYFLKTTQSNLRFRQEATQTATQQRDNQLKTLEAQSSAMAAAAAGGVKGVNVGQLLNDFTRSEGMMASRLDQKLSDVALQNNANQTAFQSEAMGRIDSVKGASPLQTLVGVATPLASFGIDYYDTKARYAAIDK